MAPPSETRLLFNFGGQLSETIWRDGVLCMFF